MSSSSIKINSGFLIGLAAVAGLAFYVFSQRAPAQSVAAARTTPARSGGSFLAELGPFVNQALGFAGSLLTPASPSDDVWTGD